MTIARGSNKEDRPIRVCDLVHRKLCTSTVLLLIDLATTDRRDARGGVDEARGGASVDNKRWSWSRQYRKRSMLYTQLVIRLKGGVASGTGLEGLRFVSVC